MNSVLPPRSADESTIMKGFRDGPDRAAMGGEWFDFGKNSEQFANNMSIGNIPLIVLTAAPQAIRDNHPLPREWQIAIESLHQELQRELAQSSSSSKHIVARKAGHNIQLDEPELILVLRGCGRTHGACVTTREKDSHHDQWKAAPSGVGDGFAGPAHCHFRFRSVELECAADGLARRGSQAH
jgi:hypothetical protein